jgi:two-component system phosphate regulon sensor histidine kinase PhoR
LIADMMQLARAQAGRAHLTITRVDIATVLAESMRSNLPVAEAKGIALSFQDADKANVMSDLEATLTIANNLIGNAIRYTSPGGHVKVSFRDAGRFLALVVEDDGVGISAGDQKRIFERFYRVSKSRRTGGDRGHSGTDGTGIGLSIVKNLTLALGGEIRLTSQPGQGARFEVLLPKLITARQSA